jgi:hypothetical protein
MTKLNLRARRNFILCAAVACFAAHAQAQESAASFPSKPVRIIVPFVAGGWPACWRKSSATNGASR